MRFNGTWKHTNNEEKIKFSGPLGGDEYLLEYEEENNKFKTSEKISLFISNEQHAHLPNSKKFGDRVNVNILSSDKIKIGDSIYVRFQQKTSS